MTVHMEEEVEFDVPFDYRELAREVIAAALEAEKFPFEAEVSLLIVSLEEIQEINREYQRLLAKLQG